MLVSLEATMVGPAEGRFLWRRWGGGSVQIGEEICGGGAGEDGCGLDQGAASEFGHVIVPFCVFCGENVFSFAHRSWSRDASGNVSLRRMQGLGWFRLRCGGKYGAGLVEVAAFVGGDGVECRWRA